MYLWVLEQNTAARAFYDARDGRCVGRHESHEAHREPSHFNGVPIVLRYAWNKESLPLGGDPTR